MPAESLVMVDFDQDGNQDLVTGDRGVRILLGSGDGSFRCQEEYALGRRTGPLAVGDLDEDGLMDLVMLSYTGVSVLMNRPR